ncbi:Nitroreductase [Candidatus Nanohalovita haloferacivicina]|nr:Nitroreductase [Candidatus Nanohalobia archaeon BNXNv]
MSSFESALNLNTFKECRDETIARKVVGKILEAGRYAPSPGNVQCLEFIVIESDDALHKLEESTGNHRISEAPTTILVIGDLPRMRKRVGSSEARKACMAEAAFSVQNMRLVAYENDLASILVSGFDENMVAQKFGVPEGKVPLMAISIGYTDNPQTSEHKFRLQQRCYYDSYGRQITSVFEGLEWKGLKEEKRIYGKKAKGLRDKLRRKLRKVL